MKLNDEPWWKTDQYVFPDLTGGPNMDDPRLWGPHGPALVQLYEDGRTGQGWGHDTFMQHYNRLTFAPRRILYGYQKQAWHFAFVMRGAKMICVDIDGKNGGFEHATELGFLPPTVAEISMGGNGYHLFYEVIDEWDVANGFGRYRDAIGLVEGVDIRGTGCVYHKPKQRWNSQPLAMLPEHLSTMLLQRSANRERQNLVIQKTLELEDYEVAMLHSEMKAELEKPIKTGKRNQTLFAIGCQMFLAGYPNWDKAVSDRATQVDLDAEEIDKLIRNIQAYGDK